MRAGIAEDERAGAGAREAARRDRRARPRRRRNGAGSSRASRTCSASPSGPRPIAKTCSRPGGCSSSASPTRPVVLVFEDLQWADAGLLDFIEYLLEWSRDHPIFVLALARPELAERRPDFGAAGRNCTTLSLEPLSRRRWRRSSTGFVPGLPDELRAQILERAEGVPLYAVETIRMLLDRGLLAREGDVYRADRARSRRSTCPRRCTRSSPRGSTGSRRRSARLLQDASVLGKSFTRRASRRSPGWREAEVEPLARPRSCARRCSSFQVDPRSPERGQYGFLQDLAPARRLRDAREAERKARHLAAAAHLEHASAPGEQEIVEVLAAHYLDAYRAAPDADDAPEIKTSAREMLTRAGERAASLGGDREAEHYFERAAELE